MRPNDITTFSMGTLEAYKPNVRVTNNGGHIENRMKLSTMVTLNTKGQISPRRFDVNMLGDNIWGQH